MVHPLYPLITGAAKAKDLLAIRSQLYRVTKNIEVKVDKVEVRGGPHLQWSSPYLHLVLVIHLIFFNCVSFFTQFVRRPTGDRR